MHGLNRVGQISWTVASVADGEHRIEAAERGMIAGADSCGEIPQCLIGRTHAPSPLAHLVSRGTAGVPSRFPR